MKHLDRREMRDRLAFLNSMISMQRAEKTRHDSIELNGTKPYALAQAAKFQKLADEFQAKADEWKKKYESFDLTSLNSSISRYLAERAKIVFLLSKRGKEIYKVLDSVPQKYHDRFLTALMSAADQSSSDETRNKVASVLKEILMEGKQE